MSFLIRCPNCGERAVGEFRFGGETHPRPGQEATFRDWAEYLYARKNEAGLQREWWFHRMGCRKWFLGIRDTTTNEVRETFWFGEG